MPFKRKNRREQERAPEAQVDAADGRSPASLRPVSVKLVAARGSGILSGADTDNASKLPKEFVERIRSVIPHERLKGMKEIPSLVSEIGPQVATLTLLPFLTKECLEDEPQILVNLAESLREIVPMLEEKELIFGHFEQLLSLEEECVRDAAVHTAEAAADALPINKVAASLQPLIDNLSVSDTFPGKCSAASLLPFAYGRITHADIRAGLRKTFAKLCADDSEEVKVSCARQLGAWASVLEPDRVREAAVPHVVSFALDVSVRVRAAVVRNLRQVIDTMSRADVRDSIVPIIRKFAADFNASVRCEIASVFGEACRPLGHEVNKTITSQGIVAQTRELAEARESINLIHEFRVLLTDPEPNVRAAAANQIPTFCALLESANSIETILPIIKSLAHDTSPEVRRAIAGSVGSLSHCFGRSFDEGVVPLFLELLRDHDSTVVLEALARLPHYSRVLGMEAFCERVLPHVIRLADAPRWRVRSTVIQYLPSLGRAFGQDDFTDVILPLMVAALQDATCEGRRRAANALARVCALFGTQWMMNRVYPLVDKLFTQANSTVTDKMTFFLFVSACSAAEIPDVGDKLIVTALPRFEKAVELDIPNLLFYAADSIKHLAQHADDAAVKSKLKPVLSSMKESSKDKDVRAFVERALEVC